MQTRHSKKFAATISGGLLLGTMGGGSAMAQSWPTPAPRIDARETVPPALLGTWKLSLAESRFPAGAAPKAQYRIFSYTGDGLLLANYVMVNADGTKTAANWTSALDDSFRPEYKWESGTSVYAMIQLIRKDERTFDLVSHKNGKIAESGEFLVSADGKSLTWTHQSSGTNYVSVYHPWDMLN